MYKSLNQQTFSFIQNILMRDQKFCQVETQQGAATLSSFPKQPPAVEMDEPNFVSRYLRRKIGEALVKHYLPCLDPDKDSRRRFSDFFALVYADIRRITSKQRRKVPPTTELQMAVRWLISPYFFPVVLSRRSLLTIIDLICREVESEVIRLTEWESCLSEVIPRESSKPLTKTFDAKNLRFGEHWPLAFPWGTATRYSLADLLGSDSETLRKNIVWGLVALTDADPDKFIFVRHDPRRVELKNFPYSRIQSRFDLWKNLGFFPPVIGERISNDTTMKLVTALWEGKLTEMKKENCFNRYLFLSDLGWDRYYYTETVAERLSQKNYIQSYSDRAFDIRNFKSMNQRRGCSKKVIDTFSFKDRCDETPIFYYQPSIDSEEYSEHRELDERSFDLDLTRYWFENHYPYLGSLAK